MDRLGVLLGDCLGDLDTDNEVPEGIQVVDCVVKVAVVVAKAREHGEEIVQLLDQWPTEAWDSPVTPLSEGPSYIHVGAVMSSQQMACALFGVGEVLGLWKVVTPQTLGFSDPEVTEMAGRGFVMIDGYRPESLVAESVRAG